MIRAEVVMAPQGALVYELGGERVWFVNNDGVRRETAPQMHNMSVNPQVTLLCMIVDESLETVAQYWRVYSSTFEAVFCLLNAMDRDVYEEGSRRELFEEFSRLIHDPEVFQLVKDDVRLANCARDYGRNIPQEWMTEETKALFKRWGIQIA